MAKLSIIVPVYNVEKYLASCVDSIMAQTFQDWELILIDDGSSDKSYQIAKDYSDTDARIKVVNNGHNGVSTARNTGIAMASGEYIMFVDSDDTITTDACEILLNAVENCDFAMATYQTVYKGTNAVVEHFVEPFCGGMDRFCQVIDAYLGAAIIQGPCWKIFRKDLILPNGVAFPKDIDFGEDAVFVYTYMKYVKTICVVNQAIYHYYVHGKSLNHGFRRDKYRINLMLNQMMADFLCNHGIDNYQEKQHELNRTAFSAYLNDCALCSRADAVSAIQAALAAEQTKAAYQDGTRLSLKQKTIRTLLLKERVGCLYCVSKFNSLLTRGKSTINRCLRKMYKGE